MTDWIWAFIKIGDQRVADGKEHLSVRDGFVVDMVDPNDPNYGPLWFPSEWMRTVYLCIRAPYSFKDNVRNWLAPIGDESDAVNYRCRSRLLQIHTMPNAAQLKIRNALDNGKVLDLTQTNTAWLFPDWSRQESALWTSQQVYQLFKESSTLNPPAVDDNSISSGSYTIGSGGDYATWALAAADLANLTGALTLTQITAVTESGNIAFAITLGGYTLTCTSTAHGGNPSSAMKITLDSALNGFALSQEGPGTLVFDNMFLERVQSVAANVYDIGINNILASHTLKICNILISGLGNGGKGIDEKDNTLPISVFNCMVWGKSVGVSKSLLANAGTKWENITVYNCGTGVDAGTQAVQLRNVACYGNTTDFANIGSSTGYNCASDDATAADGNWSTGSGNVTNGDPATDFESVTASDGAAFLQPTTGGALYQAGSNVTISGHTDYINGVTIETDDVDIGAKGLARGVTVTGGGGFRKFW